MSQVGWVRAVGVFGALWNAVGVFSYLAHVGMVGGGPPPGAAAMPGAVMACFAIGVFGGVAGSIALATLSKWARPLLWLSLIGTVVDWVWVFGWSGAPSVPLGAAVLVLAAFFVIFAEWAARRGVLR